MVKRITITISNDIYNRLQAVKERLNVSGVCQKALEKEVNIEEIKDEALLHDDDVIENLRIQKKEYHRKDFDKGYAEGLFNARFLRYEHFLRIEEKQKKDDTDLESFFADPLLERLRKGFELSVEDELSESNKRDIPFSKEEYFRGWINGTLEFFDGVKDKL